jgi:hypothetical protein
MREDSALKPPGFRFPGIFVLLQPGGIFRPLPAPLP